MLSVGIDIGPNTHQPSQMSQDSQAVGGRKTPASPSIHYFPNPPA